MRPAVVLRPEPGNAATVARLRAAGLQPIALPLFAVVPLPWTPPEPQAFDALLLTSANAPRHGGEALDRLMSLPIAAVGEATAAAARARGLTVALTGDDDATALAAAARARGWTRLLHLGGRDRAVVPGVTAIACYASEAVPLPLGAALAAEDAVVLVHSARAGERWAMVAARDGVDRTRIRLAAMSPRGAAAAGIGWQEVAIAAAPIEAALIAAAAALAIDPAVSATDKRRR